MIDQNKLSAMKRVRDEYQDIYANPLLNIGAQVGLPNKNNIMEWRCTMTGPSDSPFAHGLFFLKIKFPNNYPQKPPEVCFLTPIYHLNVNHKAHQSEPLGHVCISTLNWWNPKNNIREVLNDIFALFYLSNPDSPYGVDRANEFRANKKLYDEKCKFFTNKYAAMNRKEQTYTEDWDFTYPQ